MRLGIDRYGSPAKAVSVGVAAALLAAFCLLAIGLSPSAPTAGASEAEEQRDRYISQLEPICYRDTQRNARLLRGTRQMVANDQLMPAARRFAKATRAYTGTLRQVIRVPRPAEDRQILSNWFTYLFRQRSYLAQITRALISGERFQAQRLSMLLIRNANQANAAVVGYGFNHCQIRPGRFL